MNDSFDSFLSKLQAVADRNPHEDLPGTEYLQSETSAEIRGRELLNSRNPLTRLPGTRDIGLGIDAQSARLSSLLTRPFNSAQADIYSREADQIHAAGAAANRQQLSPNMAYAGDMLRNVSDSLTMAVPATLLGGPIGAISMAGAEGYNDALTEATDDGASGWQRQRFAAAQGALEASIGFIFQKAGLGGVESQLASKLIAKEGLKEAAKRGGKVLAQEMGEEMVTTLTQNLDRKFEDINSEQTDWFNKDGTLFGKNFDKPSPMMKSLIDTAAQTVMTVGLVNAPNVTASGVAAAKDRFVRSKEGEKFTVKEIAREFYDLNPQQARDLADTKQPTRTQTAMLGVRLNKQQRAEFSQHLRDYETEARDRELSHVSDIREHQFAREFQEPISGAEWERTQKVTGREFDSKEPLSAREWDAPGRQKATPAEWDRLQKLTPEEWEEEASVAQEPHAVPTETAQPAAPKKKSSFKKKAVSEKPARTVSVGSKAEATIRQPPEQIIEATFDATDRNRMNLVSLADLREASGLPADTFNDAIQSLRRQGKMSLSAGNGASKRERDAAIMEVDVPLAYATKESPATPAATESPKTPEFDTPPSLEEPQIGATKPAPSAPRKTKEGLTAEQQRTLAEIRATKKESDRVSDTQALRGLLGEVAPRKPKSSFKKTTAKASEPAPSKAEDVPDDMTDAEIEARLAEVEREQEQRPEPTPADDEQQQFGAFIRRMNASGKLPKSFLGKGKITISDLWKAYRKGDGTITTRDEFNRRLAEANKRGDIKLEASKLGDRDSEIVVGKDRFHQVDFNKPEDRMSVDLFRQKVREAVKDEDQADAIEKVWQSYAEGYHGKGLGEVLSRQLADIVSSDSKQANRQGSVRFMEDGRAIISSFGSSDFSTHTHEFSHIARRWLKPSDQRIADKYVGAKDGAAWSTEQEEKFARGFEKYLRTGKAPLSKIGKVWDWIKGWMREAYLVVRGTPLNVDVSPEVEGVYRRILGESPSSEPSQQTAGTDELYQSEQRRPARPDLANPGLSRPVRDLVDEADRGRERPDTRKDADVDIEANRLLRDEYQTTKERLLDAARTGRQLSDTETAAAQLLIEREGAKALKSDDDAQLEEAVALIDAYRWTGTEQARAFRQRRDRVETPAERHLRILGESVLSQSAKDRKQMEAARKDGNADALKKLIAKHREEVKRLKDTLRKLGYDPKNFDRVAPSAEASFKVLRIIQSVRSGLGDKVFEYWRNAILSAPLTQAVNTSSNALAAGWNFGVSRPIESLANVILRDNRLAQAGEHKHVVQGILPGIAKANANFLKTFKNEIPWFDYTMGRFELEKADGQDKYSVGAIGGTKGRIVRTPQRFISAVDQWFKTMIAEMDVGARAYRIARREGLAGRDLTNRIAELHGDIHSVAWAEALETADNLTFQEKPGPWTDAILKLRRDDPTGAVRYIIPFVMTPANIMKEGLRKSPLGVLRVFNQMKTASETGDWSNVKQTLIQQTLSWAAMLALFAYDEDEENPILTGAAEGFDRDKKQMGYRTGVMPMSFRVPFTESRFSYAKIEPFATALAAMVDTRNAWRRGDVAAIPMSVVGQIKEKTFLAGIADIIEAIQQPDSLRYWGANFAASWVPNIVKSTLRSADSTVPYRSITGEGNEANLQAVHRALQKTELPGIEDVPIVDLWGREAMRPGSPAGFMGSDFLWRMLSPVEYRSASINGADRAIINWNNQHPEDTFFPRAPRRDWEVRGGKKQKMTDQQYHDFAQLAGQTAKLVLDRQRFDNVEKPTANDKETIMEVISAAQTAAKKQYAAVWQGEQAAPKAASELADEVVRRKVANSREAATGKISFSRRRGETSLDAKDRFEKSKERKADARQDWQRFTNSP